MKEQLLKFRKEIGYILAIAGVAIWIFLVWKRCGIFFETNDDRVMAEILSGVTALSPDGHVVYVNFLLGKLISLLYLAFPNVAWWGACLIFAHGLFWGLLIGSAVRRSEDVLEEAVALAIGAAFLCAHLRFLGNVQFTSTAALLAAAGWGCLIMQRG